jgi:primosomal protein N' (replication factor Y)
VDELYEIAVDAPLATTLTYKQPAGRTQTIPAGCCVLVPLGNRQITGYVLGRAAPLSAEQPVFAVKNIAAVLTESPFFPAALIPFYQWIARYYHYPLGEVVRTALPLAPGSRSGRQVLLTESGINKLTPEYVAAEGQRFKNWLEPLVKNGKLEPGTVRRLWREIADRNFLQKLEQQHLVTIRPMLLTSEVKPKTQAVIYPGVLLLPLVQAHIGEAITKILEVLQQETDCSLKKAETKALTLFLELFFTANRQPVGRSTLTHHYPGIGPQLKRLLEQGILIEETERVYRDPFGEAPQFHAAPDCLTDEQQQVLAAIMPAITSHTFAPFLLFGVTGCGKTEVYLQAVQHALSQGQTALVLVPEIALASQLEAHFYSRFGSQLAVLHSGLTDGERLDQWQAVLQTTARVVLGARSAVFAPLENLGIVIVDEEHEPAYKQEDGLRYNGRDLAVLRAQLSQCPVLLGSATPSLVSYYHCRQGKYTLLTMRKRVADQQLPAVEIVDLATVERSRPDLVFSDRLISALGETLEQGKQSLLFVNRRGFSAFMLCRDCGHILQCKHCQVSLTLHRSKRTLLCHYCGYSQHPATLCPACGSTRIAGLGIGSERIEEEVQQLFPEARVARLDSDTTSNRKHYLAVLKAVRSRQVDILIGTQMIAKGLHFPHITLVGVVWADSGLGMPDYKAAERTFSLLSQVTGRAGRGEDLGRVIIQTYQPHHYAINLAQHHDYDAFYSREITARQPLSYPPFSRLVNIRFSGIKESQVQVTATAVTTFLHGHKWGNKVDILGPSPAPLVKLKDRTRWQLLLKSQYPSVLHELCEALLAEKNKLCPQAVNMSFDVDPENMM